VSVFWLILIVPLFVGVLSGLFCDVCGWLDHVEHEAVLDELWDDHDPEDGRAPLCHKGTEATDYDVEAE
jgi:hypothetical protein